MTELEQKVTDWAALAEEAGKSVEDMLANGVDVPDEYKIKVFTEVVFARLAMRVLDGVIPPPAGTREEYLEASLKVARENGTLLA